MARIARYESKEGRRGGIWMELQKRVGVWDDRDDSFRFP